MKQNIWVDSGGSSLGKEERNMKSIFNTAALSSRRLQPPKPGRSVPGVQIIMFVEIHQANFEHCAFTCTLLMRL